MKKSRIVADGDKLKSIRKKYGLKQDEISGNDITRNLISEIETGAANMTKKTAEIIIKNLKEMASKKGFKITETVEYLMENQIVQATKILDNYITELKKLLIFKDDSFIETLRDAKSFLADWNINEKATTIYEVAGDYFYIKNEMYESIMYYEKALTAVGKLRPSQELLQIFSKITKAYIHSGEYNKAIENTTFVIEHFDNLSSVDIIGFNYNRAWTYYLLKKYELALADIDKIEKLLNKNDTQTYFTILDTKAICLKKIERYDESIAIYRSLLDALNDNQLDKKLALHINITEAYMALSDQDRISKEFTIVQRELPYLNSDSQYEADIYFEVAKIYEYLDKKEEASKYYIKAKDVSKKKKNYVLLNSILYKLMNVTTMTENVDLIKDEVFKLSTKQDKLTDKLIYKLMNFYIANNNIDRVKEINNFALQFN
ncbi:helix-turn-helix domain-containing protein [Clostridium hydrogenum]|uniref:helix-turn-helix domain-containing protein n=1 Tax=Clostridium hydrogenum TaxID=2855764 RepID=UPI001F314D3C|nr:helix-turn-helix transcriptional regulator [Clostridium hydrogenum]